MKNSITDLNNHLFTALERINEEGISQDEMEQEIKRSKAVTSIAKSIVDGANVQIEIAKLMGADNAKFIPETLRLKN